MATAKEIVLRKAREFVANEVRPVLDRESRLVVGPKEYAHRVKFSGKHPVSPDEMTEHIEAELAKKQDISLYVHATAVCRHRCTFCHYPVIISQRPETVSTWMRASMREIDLLAGRFPEIRKRKVGSLYLGGGTPTLITPQDLEALMGHIRGRLAIAEDAEITIEGTPDTYTPEKIRAIRGVGINRVSVGVQILDEAILREHNRFHTPEQSLAAISRLMEAGFPQVNVDMMYGFAGQSAEKLYDDLMTVAALRPTSITVYRQRLGREDELPTALGALYDRDKITLPDPEEVYVMQHLARQVLTEQGYREGPSGWFTRLDQPIVEYHKRWVEQAALFGVGWHTYSYSGRYEYHNYEETEAYLAALREGKLPIETGWLYSQEEQARRWVFFRLKSLFEVSAADFFTRFSMPMEEAGLKEFFGRLIELGLAEGDQAGISLTDPGKVLVEEIIGEGFF